jgi:peptidoglycan/LPS O-acetylase OafA/YrhL
VVGVLSLGGAAQPASTIGASRQAELAPATPSNGFRPDIEGLRAIAVLAVVLFHAGLPGVGGGYIGVDVFFVISGFLITGLLWREVSDAGTVRLCRFYVARARRLLPAAATVGIATAIGSALLLPPLQARTVLGDGIASALYVGNYRFAVQGTDYLAADVPPSPFQHYWSLGVEEQFYLLWPALIIASALQLRRIRFRAGLLTAVAVISFALSLALTRSSPPWAFFSLPTRAWELAVGGLVALSAANWRRLPACVAAIAGCGGLGVILLSCIALGTGTAYPGTAALLPVLGTALVIGGGFASSTATSTGAGRLLSMPPMRAVGRMSYSWYLWHWPVLLLMPHVIAHRAGLADRVAASVISAGLAVITLHLVENPARFARRLRRSPARSLALAGGVTAVAVCVGITLLLVVVPVPVGRGTAVAAPKISITPTPSHIAGPRDAAVAQAFMQAQEAVAAAANMTAVPSNLTPPLADAAGDKPAVFLNGCVRSWRDVGQAECATADTASTTTAVLVGDSHAGMWSPAAEQVAAQRHWRLETLGKVTCPLQDLPIISPYLGREYTECEQWRREIINRLQAEHPRLIVVGSGRRYGADFGFTSYDPAWVDSLGRLVARLHSTGATVLVLGPIPDPHSTVPTCLSEHLADAGACSPARSVAVNDAGIAAEKAATAASGGHYADLTPLFCTAERCPVIVGNDLVYRDDNHLTIAYAKTLAPVIGALADQALAAG